ncbi:MAG: hypothetical protein ACP5E5_00920 [Acidobacteriaceae bacterium]
MDIGGQPPFNSFRTQKSSIILESNRRLNFIVPVTTAIDILASQALDLDASAQRPVTSTPQQPKSPKTRECLNIEKLFKIDDWPNSRQETHSQDFPHFSSPPSRRALIWDSVGALGSIAKRAAKAKSPGNSRFHVELGWYRLSGEAAITAL